jgi:hypothetical protein
VPHYRLPISIFFLFLLSSTASAIAINPGFPCTTGLVGSEAPAAAWAPLAMGTARQSMSSQLYQKIEAAVNRSQKDKENSEALKEVIPFMMLFPVLAEGQRIYSELLARNAIELYSFGAEDVLLVTRLPLRDFIEVWNNLQSRHLKVIALLYTGPHVDTSSVGDNEWPHDSEFKLAAP